MSLLNNLQLQQIDDSADDLSSGWAVPDDDITLNDPVDENELETYWDQVVDDNHQDPDWFTFDNK